MIGSFVYQFRKQFQHGLRAAYYRDLVRPRVRKSTPVFETTDRTCELHALTSSEDWVNLTWALKSFYKHSQKRYALCLHDDGTLSQEAKECLRRIFPQARLIARDVADQTVISSLAAYPRCLQLRQNNKLSLKLFDFVHYLDSGRMLLIDSDVLFFSKPVELLRRIDDPDYRFNSVNRDIASAYTVRPDVVAAELGFQLMPRFNSGLGLIHRESIRADDIETFLGLPGIGGHFWQIEQTLFALASSKFGVEMLPAEYDVRTERGLIDGPCRHYVGAIRHLMYSEGIRRLTRAGGLR